MDRRAPRQVRQAPPLVLGQAASRKPALQMRDHRKGWPPPGSSDGSGQAAAWRCAGRPRYGQARKPGNGRSPPPWTGSGRRSVPLTRLDQLIKPLVTARAPGLLSLFGVGPDTAAMLLIAAGDHPARLRSEAASAHPCAAAPIPASSGKTVRHPLNPGGDRHANHTLSRIVVTRISARPPPPPPRPRPRQESP